MSVPIGRLMGSIAGSQTREVSITTPIDCGKAERVSGACRRCGRITEKLTDLCRLTGRIWPILNLTPRRQPAQVRDGNDIRAPFGNVRKSEHLSEREIDAFSAGQGMLPVLK